MAFAESDRVKIRRYLGFSAIYLQADPMLENAITSIQSIADGGSRPDSSSETAVLAYITSLEALDAILDGAGCCVGTVAVNGVKMDAARGDAILKSRARKLVGYIADVLSTSPRRDVYSPKAPDPSGGWDVTKYARSHWPVTGRG